MTKKKPFKFDKKSVPMREWTEEQIEEFLKNFVTIAPNIRVPKSKLEKGKDEDSSPDSFDCNLF
jgi:hypothetical protein